MMSRQINPIVAVIIAVVVLVGIGFMSMRLFARNSEKQVVVQIPDPNNPHFRQDPKLAGGNNGPR